MCAIADAAAGTGSPKCSFAFDYVGYDWAGYIVAISSLIIIVVTTLCVRMIGCRVLSRGTYFPHAPPQSMLGQPRIYFGMSRDGLLPPAFARVNKAKTPVFSTVVTAIVVAVMCVRGGAV